jgi:hypothetical protein
MSSFDKACVDPASDQIHESWSLNDDAKWVEWIQEQTDTTGEQVDELCQRRECLQKGLVPECLGWYQSSASMMQAALQIYETSKCVRMFPTTWSQKDAVAEWEDLVLFVDHGEERMIRELYASAGQPVGLVRAETLNLRNASVSAAKSEDLIVDGRYLEAKTFPKKASIELIPHAVREDWQNRLEGPDGVKYDLIVRHLESFSSKFCLENGDWWSSLDLTVKFADKNLHASQFRKDQSHIGSGILDYLLTELMAKAGDKAKTYHLIGNGTYVVFLEQKRPYLDESLYTSRKAQ